jgi:hypothetical protein
MTMGTSGLLLHAAKKPTAKTNDKPRAIAMLVGA